MADKIKSQKHGSGKSTGGRVTHEQLMRIGTNDEGESIFADEATKQKALDADKASRTDGSKMADEAIERSKKVLKPKPMPPPKKAKK